MYPVVRDRDHYRSVFNGMSVNKLMECALAYAVEQREWTGEGEDGLHEKSSLRKVSLKNQMPKRTSRCQIS